MLDLPSNQTSANLFGPPPMCQAHGRFWGYSGEQVYPVPSLMELIV